MVIVDFYRGNRTNNMGDSYADIMAWTDEQLEFDHDYIQWMFPSNESSKLNTDSPTLTKEESLIFESDPVLQSKVREFAVRFIDFLGFKLESGKIEPKGDDIPLFLRGPFNHNILRVTRMLKSLRLTGNSDLAEAIFNALIELKNLVSQSTWNHWNNAANNPLWE